MACHKLPQVSSVQARANQAITGTELHAKFKASSTCMAHITDYSYQSEAGAIDTLTSNLRCDHNEEHSHALQTEESQSFKLNVLTHIRYHNDIYLSKSYCLHWILLSGVS